VAYDGVATPRFQVMHSASDPLLPGLAFPLLVKPDREGTSIGITQASKIHDDHELRAQVERILEVYRQPALVEEFIEGAEYTIGVVGPYVLPILEVDLTKIVRAHSELEALDYNRMDFRARDGQLHFLEANPIPGIDPATSDLPAMARRAGVSHGGLVAMILYEAVRRYARYPAHARRFAGTCERLNEIVSAQVGCLEVCDQIAWRGHTYRLVRERCESSG
jgi:D-alanine-D-alanine ligase